MHEFKRIEHRGRHLRVSRTGRVAVREQIKVAGLNLTANSKHGVRATTRIAKGTNAGFQNGNFRLRILLLAVATAYRQKAEEPALVPLYLRIDDQCVKNGGRTRLQELLLEDYAALNRLKLKAE